MRSLWMKPKGPRWQSSLGGSIQPNASGNSTNSVRQKVSPMSFGEDMTTNLAPVREEEEKGSLTEILLHVFRFQITTISVVATVFFSGKTERARSALRRLLKAGLLVPR